MTILRAHSTAVSVTTSFAGWSCCGCARRSPTLECVLKALCSRVGTNTHADDVVQSFTNSLVQKNCFVVTESLIGRPSKLASCFTLQTSCYLYEGPEEVA